MNKHRVFMNKLKPGEIAYKETFLEDSAHAATLYNSTTAIVEKRAGSLYRVFSIKH